MYLWLAWASYEDEVGLELMRDLPASASPLLGLWMCVTMPTLFIFLKLFLKLYFFIHSFICCVYVCKCL